MQRPGNAPRFSNPKASASRRSRKRRAKKKRRFFAHRDLPKHGSRWRTPRVKRLTASLPPGEAAMYLLGLKYLEALPALAQGKGSTIFLPAEAAGVMGAIGSMRELLRGRQV